MYYRKEEKPAALVAGVIVGKTWRHTPASVEATTSLNSVSALFLSLHRDTCIATDAAVLRHHFSCVAVALIAGTRGKIGNRWSRERETDRDGEKGRHEDIPAARVYFKDVFPAATFSGEIRGPADHHQQSTTTTFHMFIIWKLE